MESLVSFLTQAGILVLGPGLQQAFVSSLPSMVSALVALLGLGAGWFKWRDSQLRRTEVHAWANQVIAAMETILLLGRYGKSFFTGPELCTKFKELSFTTSILLEQGRLFFRNQRQGAYGMEKSSAYRGLRPLILDQILIAHLIAVEWLNADSCGQARLRFVAEGCLRNFVSLVQKEVGRSRSASAEAKRGGNRIDLKVLMAGIDGNALDRFLRKELHGGLSGGVHVKSDKDKDRSADEFEPEDTARMRE